MPPDFDYRAIDEIFHSRIRLAIASVLVSAVEADFTHIRDAIGATDGNLNTHMGKLEEAGYVDIRKGYLGKKPLTTYRLTEKGRKAFTSYVENLGRFLEP
jgi:DNA-binding transcriptional ArsR family regulator